jgi:hypothetical protein
VEEPFYQVAGGRGAAQFGSVDQPRPNMSHGTVHGARRCVMVLEDSPDYGGVGKGVGGSFRFHRDRDGAGGGELRCFVFLIDLLSLGLPTLHQEFRIRFWFCVRV